MYIIILGAQGSGKGTVAKMLAQKTNLHHISTGDFFREQIKLGTELGRIADSYISKGNLVPDDITIDIVRDRLNWEDAKNGAIIDGFPRTVAQAEALDKILAEKGKKLTLVPELRIPHDILIQRIANRINCSNPDCGAIYNKKFKPPKVEGICDVCGSKLAQRVDDSNEEAVKARLDTYYKNAEGIISYYQQKGLLYPISPENPHTDNSSKEIVEALLKVIGKADFR